MRAVIISVIVSLFALTGIFSFPDAEAVLITVNSNNDDNDGTCDGSHCSLREAIHKANLDVAVDNIRFTGSMTISPTSPLPNIIRPVNIDGVLNTVTINGQFAGGSTNGLVFSGGASTVKNLIIIKFGDNGLTFNSPNNVIEGNFIGTNPAGNMGLGNGFHGIQVSGSGTAIGGTIPAARNVISGNAGAGIAVFGSSNTVILGNYIGTGPLGTGAIGNFFGIQLTDSPNTIIGGLVPGVPCTGVCNVISGNTGLGIGIFTNFPPASATSAGINNEEFTVGKEILPNNYISTENSLLSFDLGNFDSKVVNLNKLELISIADIDSSKKISNQETELPNFSGVSVDLGSGTELRSADDNKIQPFTEVDGIVAAAFINAGSNIEGNYIGLDINGSPLGNGAHGIQITAVPDNTIGGTTVAARNYISSNGLSGISIDGVGASGNVIHGNFIGTNLDGDDISPNSSHGIQIDGAPNNVIGGLVPGEDCTGKCNLISGNGGNGILMGNTHGMDNTVQGNFIGTNLAGTAGTVANVVFGNRANGIQINGPFNVIGGGPQQTHVT